MLKAAGELDHTLIVVTSDHGMPFPRVKGQIYEDGFHLPLAMRWGDAIKPGRVVDDFVNVRDFAPTYLELAGLKPHPQMTGRSLVRDPSLREVRLGRATRNVMLAGKERHDLGRPYDWGYPVRAIRTPEFLYVHNYFPERWPAGNPETDFGNCDPSPDQGALEGHRRRVLRDVLRQASAARALPAHRRSGVRPQPGGRSILSTDDEQAPRADAGAFASGAGSSRLGNGAMFDTYKYVAGRAKGYDTWLKSQTATGRPK